MQSPKLWNVIGALLVCLMIPHLILWLSGSISARVFAGVAVVVVAAIHIYFGLLEGTQWNHPAGLAIHGLGQDVANQTRQVGRNMGLYNVIFAIGLIGTLFLGRLDAFRVQTGLLSLIIVAGLFGTLTIGSPKIVIVQSLPAALALAALILGRPGTLSEQQAIRQIIEVEKTLLEIKSKARAALKEPIVLRGQHPKSVGFVVADFVVREDVPEELKFGVFRVPGPHPDPNAVVRFSNARVMNDSEPGGHGLAIKLFGIEGDKLMPAASETKTQDFLLFDNPSFFIRDAFDYVDFESAQLWSSDADGEVSKARLALSFPNVASLSKLTLQIQTKPPANPLGATYWSVVPYRLGPHAVKFRARPLGKGAAPITGKSESSINEALSKGLNSPPEGGWKFSFEAQLQLDPDLMPIEDATVEWRAHISPFVPLATIEIKPDRSRERFGEHLGFNAPTSTTDDEKFRKAGEDLSFSPWHGLVEHEPLGGINRVRRQVYVVLSALRHEKNQAPMVEPQGNKTLVK